MAGDDLTIALFFIGLAASFGGAAMSQAGWKHKALIISLFIIAALFFLVGMFWPWIKGISPQYSAMIGELANKPISWFVMIMFGLGIALFRGRKVERIFHSSPSKIENGLSNHNSEKTINPLENIFNQRIIDINDFFRIDFQQWEGKTFNGCEINGPGPVILNGFTNLNGGGFRDCDFVKIKANHPINFAIAFNNTNFINCQFYRVVVYVPEYMAATFDGMGANWITL